MPQPTEPARPDRITRRTALRSLAVAAVATPVALSTLTANATTPVPGATPSWHPVPATDGVNAFEGVEADRKHLHPGRKYVYVEGGDHYRFNIWADDRDSTGNNDRQRTEVRGMVQNGTKQEMHNGETWVISYEMYMPSTLHGTSKFTHIFQTKTPSTNAGPWVTLDLSRSGSKEILHARAYANSGSPDIATTDLAPLRDKWISIQWTITPGTSGKAAFIARNGTGSSAPVAAKGSMSGVTIPDQGDYVRPKWGIYRSVESDPADIIDTYLLFRNYSAGRVS